MKLREVSAKNGRSMNIGIVGPKSQGGDFGCPRCSNEDVNCMSAWVEPRQGRRVYVGSICDMCKTIEYHDGRIFRLDTRGTKGETAPD